MARSNASAGTENGFAGAAETAMPRCLPALLMLTLLTAALISPITLGAARPPDHDSVTGHHAGGAPCPDGDGDGACPDGCPCFCCPGHTTAVAPYSAGELTIVLHAALSSTVWPPEDETPDGICHRVFRPPRA